MSAPTIIEPLGPAGYADYGRVSPAFLVRSVLACTVVERGLGGLLLREQPVAAPYRKYEDDDGPADWARTWDLSAWGVFAARLGGDVIGGATVAPPSDEILVTQWQPHAAALWDLRVAEGHRGRGVGTALLAEAAAWARERGYRTLRIETQHNNVPACRFYARRGCLLAEIRRGAYARWPALADEAMLVWELAL